MALKPLLWTLSLTLSASFTAATSFNLSSEITRLVPSCARECFRSHLSANYALTTCGSAPSLQCLCANVGFSGLTIGEGAVQCIVAEKSIGFCRESDTPQTVIDAAYQMCAHQPGAIQPTHTAIIATLILPTSGGIIVVPPRTTTQVITPTSTTHLTTSIPTTLISATGTPSIPNTLKTLTRSNTSRISTTSGAITPPPLPSSSTTTPSSTETPVPGAEEANSGPSERLGTGQVAGLAVGLAAALGLAVLAICLARRKRRRDYPDVKTGFFPVREKDSWEFHPQEGPANIFHISPPVHHAQSPSPPPRPPPAVRARTSGRTSWWPGAIGLAVSRSESPATALRPPPPQQDRPTSRLLPAKPSLASPKPVLSLKIPQIDLSSSSPPQPQEQRGSQPTNSQIFKTAKLTAPPKSHYNARESTMTEFEEDGAITSARSARSNNIWRPPSATVGNNPKSATYYVADKNGNWVLGDPKSATHMAQIAELDASGASEGGGAKVKPSYAESAMLAATATTAGMGHGAGSPVAPSAARMPPPPLLLPAAEIVRSGALTAPPAAHQSRSSSLYSQGTTRPNTGIQTGGVPQTGGAPHPVPSMSFSHPEPPRRRSNSLGRRSSSKSRPGTTITVPATTTAATGTFNAPKRSDSHDSHASATTIASSVASSEPEPVIEQSSLSPVVESPASNASPSGRSPVSYPAIPGRTSSKPRSDNLRLLAPPTRTYGGFPPGQPSPTLGMMQQQQQQQQARNGPYMASYDVPRKPVARYRPAATDPNRVATGSPSLRLVTPSPPSEAEGLQQEPHWKPAQTQRPPQMRPLYPPPLQPQRPRIESSNFHPQPLSAQVQQAPLNQEPQSATVYKALWGDPPPRSQQQQQQQQQQQSDYSSLPSQQQQRQQQQPRPQPSQQSFSQRQRRRSQQQRQSFQPMTLPEQSPPPRQPLPERPSSASPSPHHIATQALRPTPYFTSTPASSSTTSSKTALPPRPPSPQAASPSVATPSTTSSLLSKRLGSERAAALALPTAGIRHSPNWRPHRPGGAAGAGGGTDMLLSPDDFFPAPPGFPSRSGAGAGDLPSTPTWQPKLTPTRRGDDLFLNVQ
ncbi:CFEM domain-containing protein [Colletotrichum incanum]|nr:CFEM domain-containing protein [Colletotrichum incanum]